MQAALTVFLGSFLAFLVQPMLGRVLLPAFGGSASVWGVCLAVYQALLLLGYFLAYRIPVASQKPLRRYTGALYLSAVWSAIGALAISRNWLSSSFAAEFPWLGAPLYALLLVGLPYVLLSAGGILLQAAIAASGSGKNPYRLYSVSNCASLLALVVYPLICEPFIPVSLQWLIFAVSIAVYAFMFTGFIRNAAIVRSSPSPPVAVTPSATRRSWVVLPALFSFSLNASVAHLFTDVTPMPFVWNIVLCAFLAGWIAGFSRLGGKYTRLWALAALISVFCCAKVLGLRGHGSFTANLIACISLMSIGGCVLTRMLYESRPAQSEALPRFYLLTALGGALGGFAASFAAPMLYPAVWEFPCVLLALAAIFMRRLFKPGLKRATIAVLAGLAIVSAAGVLYLYRHPSNARVVARERGFYGCLRVTRKIETIGEKCASVSYLWCGQTTHGLQVRGSNHPFSYYMPETGGVAFRAHPEYRDNGRAMNVGIVGLGAGAMVSYGRPGDLFRFYEINPQMIKIAANKNLFTFMSDAMCPIDVVEGDARVMLGREAAKNDPLYDVLVLDAYSGDAVPYHLITREAVELYLSRLKKDGILAMHVSNWHIDLLPVCKALAESCGLYLYGIVSPESAPLISGTIWVFMTRNPIGYPDDSAQNIRIIDWSKIRSYPVPRDACGSLLPLMR